MPEISFFTGNTFDGERFVISVEGGGEASDPGIGSGLVGDYKVRGLTARQAIFLRHELPVYDAAEVFLAICRAKQSPS